MQSIAYANGNVKQKSLTVNASCVIPCKVPWLIENFIMRKALNGIQGIMGEGKSWITGAIVRAVADGGFWLSDIGERISVPQGRVLLANFDDDMNYTIVPRLLECGISCEGLNNVEILDRSVCCGMNFADTRLAELFEKFKPDLAIFDTLQHFIGSKTDLYRANEVNTILLNIQNIATKYNTAVVIVEHITKQAANGNGGHSVNWGLGSVAIAGLFRTVWTVGELRNDIYEPETRAIVHSKGNEIRKKPPAKLFKIDSDLGGFIWRGIDYNITADDLIAPAKKNGRPPKEIEETKKLICELLENGVMESNELQEIIIANSISKSTYKRARKELEVKVCSQKNGKDKIWYSGFEVQIDKFKNSILTNETEKSDITEENTE